MPSAANGTSEYVKLEQRLVLLAWLNDRFGYENNRDMLAGMKETAEGFDASGRSYIYHRQEARGDSGIKSILFFDGIKGG
jgi:hypothetical protein